MKTTRYAIWIDRTIIGPGGINGITKYWHCQGAPKDPSDFGFAILYATKERAMKTMSGRFEWMKKCATIISIDCEYFINIEN